MGQAATIRNDGLEAAQLLSILDEVRDLVVVFAPDRSMRYANRAALEAMSRHAEGSLAQSVCALRHPQLAKAIDRACEAEAGSAQAVVLKPEDDRPVVVLIKCLRGRERNILLLASDLQRSTPQAVPSLMQYFGLTKSEAEVAAALAAGSSTAEIAHDRGVTLHTVRSQIKNIAAKLGCSRRSEITAVVRAIPATVR